MIVAVGCDHAGFPIKDEVIKTIERLGHKVIDCGTNSAEAVDYPDYAAKVAKAVEDNKAQRGILICGSGIGACIAANKFKGVRASITHDLYSAAQGVMHDDMNIMCLGCRVIGQSGLASKLTEKFLGSVFEADQERHLRRLNKVLAIEKENFK